MAALGGGPASSKAVAGQSDNIHNCSDTSPSVTVTVTNTGNGGSQSGVCNTSCTIALAATAGTHALAGGTYTTSPAGTIIVKLNGAVINTVTIPSDQSQNFNDSFSYTPTTSGSGIISADVVDSVLYDATGNANATYSAALANFTGTRNSDNTITYSWTGGVASFTVSSPSNSQYGCATSSNSCTSQIPVVGSVQITLTDSSGNIVGPQSSPRKSKKKN
jgi:hypothetical protein